MWSAVKMNILVVDDESELRSFLSEVVTAKGHKCYQAENGIKALNIIKERPIDIVVSDIRMPEMDGLQLFENVKSKNIPVILITGFSCDFDIKKAEELGVADFLQKPFGMDDITNSLELVIHQLTQKFDAQSEADLDHEYCRVHIDDFISGSKIGQDVFLRLSHDKYLRVAKSDSPLSPERLNSYSKKGLNYLYIKKEDFANYVGFNLKLAQSASTRAPIPRSQKLRLIRQTAEVYLQNSYINGVDKDSFEAGKALVETALHMVTEADNLFELIEMLRKNDDATYAHCLGVSLYAALMAKQVGWNSASTIFKISMAGLLHDIGKKEISPVILRKTRMEMTPQEIELYETHPVRGRDLLSQVPCVPEEVIVAALQHHETMSGIGFPYRIPRVKLHAFAKIIAVADEFCHLSLKGPMGTGLHPHESLRKIFETKEQDYDMIFVRALMEICKYPVPDKLKKIRMFNDTKAS